MCRTFEQHADPSSQLLNAWSTDYVTLGQLVDCLKSAGLLRQATFLLGLVHPAPAPEPPSTDAPPASVADDSPDKQFQIAFTELGRWTSNFNDTPVHNGGCLLGQGGYADVFKGFTGCTCSGAQFHTTTTTTTTTRPTLC